MTNHSSATPAHFLRRGLSPSLSRTALPNGVSRRATRCVKRAEQAVLEGVEAGLNAARAGNLAGDAARALHRKLSEHGIERTGRCGYPIGLSYPPDWGERTISFRETDETELRPGMTFHFMPGLWMDSWGLEITETIVIEPAGPARPLADVPRTIVVKP